MAVKLNRHDLEFILDQIRIAEAHVAGTPLDQQLTQPHLPYGLRTVDGSYNNLIEGRENWGAADQIMPRALQPFYRNEGDDTYNHGIPMNNDYGVVGEPTDGANAGHTGNVVDRDPRIISNLVTDQTLRNPAAIAAALQHAEYSGDLSDGITAVRTAYQAYLSDVTGLEPNHPDAVAAKAALDQQLLDEFGIEMDGNSIALPNVAPDEGLSAPFSGWMTFFGQFFDHGLDLIHKGDNGTIYMPLMPDDPLITHGPDGIPGSGDEVNPNMPLVLTRLTPTIGPGPDGELGTADDTPEARNKTTPFVDQNQTYTSHPSHQVFLREYAMVDGKPMATGRLLNGENGGLATWADVKKQAKEMLGIELDDRDIFGVPLVLTDPYGEFIRDENGYPQIVINIGPDLIPNTEDDVTVSGVPTLVSGDPNSAVALAELNNGLGPVRTSHAFLDDIAHTAVPVLAPGAEPGTPAILQPDPDSGTDQYGNPVATDDRGQNVEYDNELLDKHFITGDGRGNENIGLTAVHHVFHSEHNRQVADVKKQILEMASSGLDADIAFLNDWLLEPVEAGFDPNTLQWDGERLFQTARFATEMQYQHLVFEEFGRKVQPNIDVFVFNTITDVNPAIFAEFAHTVYRFGHSMLTDHLKLLPLNEDGQPVDAQGNLIDVKDWGVDVGLIEAFLNPVLFDQDGAVSSEQAAGAIVRGLTYVRGNEIDEFVVDSLRNNLLGLPLDLAAINIARGRDAGVPSLNESRAQLYEASGSTWLEPYVSWADFGANLKTPASIVNFIAAYGTHPLLLAADTLEEKRDVAMQLIGLADATEIEAASLLNASFEANSLASGQPGVTTDALGNYTTTAPDGWTLTGQGGLIAPANTVVDPAGITGSNVAWLRQGGLLSQDTGQVLEEGVSYRLTLDIGDRTNMDWPGGQARLVDSNGNVLATVELAAPADGGWSTVTFETGPIDVSLAGLGLSIEIQQTGGTSNQILIDNVRLDVVRPGEITDRLDFLNSTGAWTAENSGLNDIDLWIGGLAEKIMPFGGMLGSTFNAIFELQMENLQEGDRFYYLSRTQGLNLLNELEDNAFSKMIMANTDLTQPGPDGIRGTDDDIVTHHIGVDSFANYDGVLEVDESRQIALDPEGDDPFLNAVREKVERDDPNTAGADTNYLRFTGGEHMVMGGTAEADTIIGGDGDDGIWGGAGNDRIEGGHGVDLIIGGAGDDIITDTGDTGDFIKGGSGDDVIANSNGLDVVMGGDGTDVVIAGVDATEVFAGEGNDFILGGLDHDFILGNEGDDWMEGGDGFDVLNGDNSELFFNSTILGHDVMIAGENENDFDAESGDDIMVQGESVMRNEGMLGFDWAIYKGNAVAADADMRIPIFTTVADDILRDRFDQTEGLSGWIHNDVLRGDDRGSQEEIEVEFDLTGHELTQAGLNRIDGLRELLGIEEFDTNDPNVDLESIIAWTGGNIILGGDGNDTFEGRGGDDFIHGDAWLNVRIGVRTLDAEGNVTDTPLFSEDIDSLKQIVTLDGETKPLSAFLLSGQIKPKQLQIVREVKYAEDASDDTDTAIFAGNRDWYEITHVGDRTYVARREQEEIDPQVDEGTDTLIGIERIQFSDGFYTIRETGNYDPTGRLLIEGLPAREGQPLVVNAGNIRDLNNPDGMVPEGSITYRWQIERNDGTGDYIDIPNASGNTFTPDDEHSGLRIRVLGTYVDSAGVTEIVSSQPTDVVLGENDEPSGSLLISDMTPTEGQMLTATVAFTDADGLSDAFEEGLLTYQWQYFDGTDWQNVPAEDGGNARSFTPGPDHVGHPLRIVVVYEDDLTNEHTVISAVTQVVGNYIASDAPVIDGVAGDEENRTTIGDDWVDGGDSANQISGGLGNDVLNGGAGGDTLEGGEGDDTLTGGEGTDIVNGGGGDDTVIYGTGDDTDLVDGGEGDDTLRIVQSSNGSSDIISVNMSGGVISQAGGAILTSVENVELDAGGGDDTLIYNTADDVSVNLLTGTATGFSFTRGLEHVTTGTGDDTVLGNSLDNAFSGGDGDDTLRGGFGSDDITGGAGDDQLWGEAGDDLLQGGEGDDRIDGGEGSDTASYANAASAVTVSLAGLTSFEEQDTGGGGIDRLIEIENLIGSSHGDVLTGSDDHNVIDGGAGADNMSGGLGDDTYIVDDAADVVNEAADSGNDTVRSTLASYALAANVENLVLTGGAIAGTGNELDNELTGNSGDNALDGGLGNDTVVLEGEITDYTFGLDGGNITVTSAEGGTDTLIGIERARIGGSVYQIVAGSNGANNPLTGTAADELLLGFNGADTIAAGAGDDIIVGGLGGDTMQGGAGDDTYVVEQGADLVDETGGDGTDTILSRVTRNLNNANHAIGEIENVTLVGSNDINALGNSLDNVLTGNSGSNLLAGQGGADELFGNGGDDDLRGGSGNDVLAGGDGNDTLNGQGGAADVAVFDGPAGNYNFGLAGGGLATVTDMVGQGGTDTLENIERIQFGDGQILNIVTGGGDVTATDPAIIFGGDGDDTIIGSEGDDVIIGGAGDDTLNGHDVGDGDDNVVNLLADDDTFIWRPGDGSDTINGGGEGVEGDLFQIVGNEAESEIYRIYTYDEAVARIAFAGSDETEIVVTRQVAGEAETVIAELTEIEEIVVNGSGISGDAEAGNDTVEMYGNFDVTTSLRPDTITVIGSSGDDTVNLVGLLSAHRVVFRGAGGNDVIIGTLRQQDVVELQNGKTIHDYIPTTNPDGSTTITSEGHSVTFYSPYGMPTFVSEGEEVDQNEDQDTPGPNDGNEDPGEGDDTSNEDESGAENEGSDNEESPATAGGLEVGDEDPNVLVGSAGADTLIGRGGDDVAMGGAGADIIRGDDGDDFLNGEGGRDVIFGGDGDDDLLGGAEADALYGEAGADHMLGGTGNDLIDGGSGDDTVFGGAGNDTLVARKGDGDDTYYGDDMDGGSGIDTLDMSAITTDVTANLGTGLGGQGSASSSESGSDTLWSVENIVTGSGDDTITASGSINMLDGGQGEDTFRFLTAADADGDTIVSFQPGDNIDVSAIDAVAGASGNQSFTLVSGAFSGAAGELLVSYETRDGEGFTVVEGNTSGGSEASFKLSIKGTHNLTESDFTL